MSELLAVSVVAASVALSVAASVAGVVSVEVSAEEPHPVNKLAASVPAKRTATSLFLFLITKILLIGLYA